jgi:hypothetical protein
VSASWARFWVALGATFAAFTAVLFWEYEHPYIAAFFACNAVHGQVRAALMSFHGRKR